MNIFENTDCFCSFLFGVSETKTRVIIQTTKENQKLNSTFKSSIKNMTHGIGALYFVILLMALVSIVTGPIGDVLGIDSMYSALHHTITHTQSAWGYLWYIAYIVPYILFILILWGCLSILRLFED